MRIGGVTIAVPVALAPMAGVSDLAFRTICRQHGCGYTVTEMVSAKALMYQDKKTCRLLELGQGEHPAGVQIFGSDPACMAEAADKAVRLSDADIVDINMGCPTPKIVNNGDGCALMKTPELARDIIEATVRAASVPVTVKMRLGWDKGSINCVEFAQMAQQAGAAAVCVHGRTKSMQYGGVADHDMVAKVKAAVSIPVWVNGDVHDVVTAQRALAVSGADGVMIGRAAFGNPWLFGQVAAALRGEPIPALPTVVQRVETAQAQFALAHEHLGERVAVLEARKHFAWYLRGLPYMQPYKLAINAMQSSGDFYALAAQIKRDNGGHFSTNRM